MKSKIAIAFDNCKKEKRPALITYIVAGDNTKTNSLKILSKISKHADILELGFPYNTPIADGGQIQGSAHRALKKGIKLQVHYVPIYRHSYYKKKFNLKPSNFPNTENFYNQVVSIPIYYNLKKKTQFYIVNCLKKYLFKK